MQRFRKLDIFKKVPRDLSEGTNLGGCISILALFLMIFFIVSELYRFFNQPLVTNIILDKPFTREQLTINLDIEFARLPCQIISLDLQDQMMSHHPNIASIKKYRLDSQGKMIDQTDFQLLRQKDQVKQFQMASLAFSNNYGCRLRGNFTVKEVPGNFHISSHSYQSLYMLLSMSGLIDTIDVSHKIHYLFIGQISDVMKVQRAHPGFQLTPLNSFEKKYKMQTPHSYISHYHIDIVPTLFYDGFSISTAYQYTYNHNSFQIDHMPALYFNYHIGGTRVSYEAVYGKFNTLVLNICAVIGGIYALCHFIYNLLFQLLDIKLGYERLVN